MQPSFEDKGKVEKLLYDFKAKYPKFDYETFFCEIFVNAYRQLSIIFESEELRKGQLYLFLEEMTKKEALVVVENDDQIDFDYFFGKFDLYFKFISKIGDKQFEKERKKISMPKWRLSLSKKSKRQEIDELFGIYF